MPCARSMNTLLRVASALFVILMVSLGMAGFVALLGLPLVVLFFGIVLPFGGRKNRSVSIANGCDLAITLLLETVD